MRSYYLAPDIQGLVDLRYINKVESDLGVPPSRPAAQPLLPNSRQHRQNWADSGTLKIQFNPTQPTSRWDTLYTCCESNPYDNSELKNQIILHLPYRVALVVEYLG